jgi:hypothetical protein
MTESRIALRTRPATSTRARAAARRSRRGCPSCARTRMRGRRRAPAPRRRATRSAPGPAARAGGPRRAAPRPEPRTSWRRSARTAPRCPCNRRPPSPGAGRGHRPARRRRTGRSRPAPRRCPRSGPAPRPARRGWRCRNSAAATWAPRARRRRGNSPRRSRRHRASATAARPGCRPTAGSPLARSCALRNNTSGGDDRLFRSPRQRKMIFGSDCTRTVRHSRTAVPQQWRLVVGPRAVTRYLEISTELARRVRHGDLLLGGELPAVRGYARELGATSSTIVRAYRHLADAGVITLADRRRARVSTDGSIAAARLLKADRVFRLAGSDDPALQVLLPGPRWPRSGAATASTACAPWHAETPTAPRSTCATTPASTTPPTPVPCSVASARTCCTCGAANRALSSRPGTRTTSPARPTWSGGSSPAANPAPEPGCCSTSCSSPPAPPRTPSPARS